MTPHAAALRRLGWVTLFAAAFALVEASVVIYLRSLYYPGGFAFPLQQMVPAHIGVELARETATLIMLAAVGILSGAARWDRFGGFLVAFGVWDILFYAWLKVLLGWPATFLDWDILFLLPVPWIGPVFAPLSVAALITLLGLIMVMRVAGRRTFRPQLGSWLCAIGGTAVILVSFMIDTGAGLQGAMPAPYRYDLLLLGLLLFVAGFVAACRGPKHPDALENRL
jgi:hypothetical protein